MGGVAVGVMALVIVLSVFNGLENMLQSLYNYFDPQIKVVASTGKSFEVSDQLINSIKKIEGVEIITQVVEDEAYVRYKNAEMVVKIKGVADNFIQHHRLDERIVQGDMKLKENGVEYAVIGQGVQYALNITKLNNMYTLQFFYPKRGQITGGLNPNRLVNHKVILVSGVFAIEKQYDLNYVFVPLDFAVDLLDYGSRRTSLEVKVKDGYSIAGVQNNLKSILGDKFNVLNSDEQHADILRVLKWEKLFVYITFSFILAVASFNIFFSLTMLAIDKKKDIAILYSLGANKNLIKNTFLSEGSIISFTGAIAGLALGYILCFAQQQFGFISMGMQTAVLEAYPIKMEFQDFLYTSLSILVITFLASFRPASIATKINPQDNL